MKSTSALIERYRQSISLIPEEIRSKVNKAGGLSEGTLLELMIRPRDYSVNQPSEVQEGVVEEGFDPQQCFSLGDEAINSGKVAYCIMAGGAGTRIGEPKALLRVPGVGVSLLTLKLFQAVGKGPIWVIVSPSNKERVIDHVRSQVGFDHDRISFLEQYESYRLSADNQVIFHDGLPELYPCGHGDLFQILVHSGALEGFVKSGGKYVSVVNVDNVAASLEPINVGKHILTRANVSCEVVERTTEESGGFLCNVNGSNVIVESFKMFGVEPRQFKWLNTNSITFNANLNLSPLGTEWNRVQKNVNGRVVIQHERLLQEITEAYDTRYFAVNRNERFIPVKNMDDLLKVGDMLNANPRLR